MSSFIKNVLVLGLALISTGVLAHAHHDEGEQITLTDSKREELLMKWEQEVYIFIHPSTYRSMYTNVSSGRSRAFLPLRI